MKRWAVLGLLILTTCHSPARGPARGPLCEGDLERLRWLMGENDWHLLEIQRGAGDPMEPEYVRNHVLAMESNLKKVLELKPYADNTKLHNYTRTALRMVETMKGEWTVDNRQEHWDLLKQMCAMCHDEFDPGLNQPPKHALAHLTGASSWESCGKCHTEIYKEWEPGLHAKAWVDPVYRQSAGKPPKLNCRGCHSMEPILWREYSTDVGWRPQYRGYNQNEGVNCVSCHLLSDGSVATGREHPGAPCRPTLDARVTTPEYCGACHNPSHLAYDEWKGSAAAKMGINCRSCHLPEKLRIGADGKWKKGFDHTFLGGNSPELVKRAITWECGFEKSELVIKVTNRMAHKFPGEVPSRVFKIRVAFMDENGDPLRDEYLNFRRAIKGEIGWKDNRILPDETRVIRQAIPDGAAYAYVHFLFQQSMFMQPKGWIDLGRWESEIR